jgi:hypothetical protein
MMVLLQVELPGFCSGVVTTTRCEDSLTWATWCRQTVREEIAIRITTLLASVERCSRPETNPPQIAFFATTLLVTNGTRLSVEGRPFFRPEFGHI